MSKHDRSSISYLFLEILLADSSMNLLHSASQQHSHTSRCEIVIFQFLQPNQMFVCAPIRVCVCVCPLLSGASNQCAQFITNMPTALSRLNVRFQCRNACIC